MVILLAWRVAGLAGSVLTVVTGMPVVSEIADEKTGSYGRVNIVVPRPSRHDITKLHLFVRNPNICTQVIPTGRNFA